MMAAAAIRLSYFSTYGLAGGTKYTGLALDNNNIILVFIFLFESALSEAVFAKFFYLSCVCLGLLNVSKIKTPKFSGNRNNVYILIIYLLAMTGVYSWKLL